MSNLTAVPRKTIALEDVNGRFTTRADLRSTTASVTGDTVLSEGTAAYDDTTLARLGTNAVEVLTSSVGELSDEDLGVFEELAARGRFYGVFTNIGTGDAWYDFGRAVRNEVAERYHRHASLIPSYTTEAGVPSSVGNVTTRLLKNWVVEAKLMSADDANSRNPNYRTITAQVEREIRISADTNGWIGRLTDERAWQLESLDDDTTFAIAPIAAGEDTTVWPRDDFAETWSDPWYPVEMTTWPTKTSYTNR